MYYEYFNANGPTRMPSRAQVIRLALDKGALTALVIDANVCLDLAALAQSSLTIAARNGVQRFVEDVTASGVDVVPGFGLAELSLNRETWSIDSGKIQSLERSLTQAIDSAPGRKEQRGDQLEAKMVEPVSSDLFRPLIPLFKVFYGCLLKVALLSTAGLSRERAMPNLRAFMTWMSEELGCVSALSLQAALAIFGGDSLARRLIGAGRSLQPLRGVWSGAWDIFYVHQLYRSTLYPIDGIPHYPIFVTRDRACYEVFSHARLRGAIRFGVNRSPFIVGLSSEYPHFAKHQQEVARLFETCALGRVETLAGDGVAKEEQLNACIESLESALQKGRSE
jgi:hypothetical protein